MAVCLADAAGSQAVAIALDQWGAVPVTEVTDLLTLDFAEAPAALQQRSNLAPCSSKEDTSAPRHGHLLCLWVDFSLKDDASAWIRNEPSLGRLAKSAQTKAAVSVDGPSVSSCMARQGVLCLHEPLDVDVAMTGNKGGCYWVSAELTSDGELEISMSTQAPTQDAAPFGQRG